MAASSDEAAVSSDTPACSACGANAPVVSRAALLHARREVAALDATGRVDEVAERSREATKTPAGEHDHGETRGEDERDQPAAPRPCQLERSQQGRDRDGKDR